MIHYAVIDTNVFISAMLKRNSNPGKINIHVEDGKIVPLVNKKILSEYIEVMQRPKFRFTLQKIDETLLNIIQNAIFIEPDDLDKLEELIPDPKDAVFYEVVMEARNERDAYLVTGNLKHFPIKTFIVTPREMLDIIERAEEREGD